MMLTSCRERQGLTSCLLTYKERSPQGEGRRGLPSRTALSSHPECMAAPHPLLPRSFSICLQGSETHSWCKSAVFLHSPGALWDFTVWHWKGFAVVKFLVCLHSVDFFSCSSIDLIQDVLWSKNFKNNKWSAATQKEDSVILINLWSVFISERFSIQGVCGWAGREVQGSYHADAHVQRWGTFAPYIVTIVVFLLQLLNWYTLELLPELQCVAFSVPSARTLRDNILGKSAGALLPQIMANYKDVNLSLYIQVSANKKTDVGWRSQQRELFRGHCNIKKLIHCLYMTSIKVCFSK